MVKFQQKQLRDVHLPASISIAFFMQEVHFLSQMMTSAAYTALNNPACFGLHLSFQFQAAFLIIIQKEPEGSLQSRRA